VAGIELIRSFLQQANSQGSRSTALNPLGWALALILSAMLCTSITHLPSWVLPLLSGFAALVVGAFLAAYFFLLLKDRDGLRSERFHLSKIAIERGITGERLAGFIDGKQSAPHVPVVSETLSRIDSPSDVIGGAREQTVGIGAG
jgi:hypothetical protein